MPIRTRNTATSPNGTTASRLTGRLTSQFLDDGFWLCDAAFVYDLIYELPSWTAEERRLVHEKLFKAIADEFSDPVQLHPGQDYLSSEHNRSALCTSAVLIAGYATEDQKMVNDAIYGTGGNKGSPTGGLIKVHFGEKCLLPDGLWLEGAPGYQLGIASCGLFNDAEVLWHHGIDMYRYRGGVLKRLLDSAIALAYPDAKMSVACLHDSGRLALLDDRAWVNNEFGLPYAFGYRRYHDPTYIPIIKNAQKTLSMTGHAGGPSVFQDLPPDSEVPPRPIENANFYSVGYGVLRLAAPGGANQLIQEFGVSGSHGHPSKLGIDLYALGDALMPFPGVIFPYYAELDIKWYWTTLGNNVMEVDEQPQIYEATRYKYPKNLPNPDATQLVYGPASTMGIERAWSNTVYHGVTQDRALFLTPQYLADIYGGFSNTPHKYDLAWHFRGAMTTSLKTDSLQISRACGRRLQRHQLPHPRQHRPALDRNGDDTQKPDRPVPGPGRNANRYLCGLRPFLHPSCARRRDAGGPGATARQCEFGSVWQRGRHLRRQAGLSQERGAGGGHRQGLRLAQDRDGERHGSLLLDPSGPATARRAISAPTRSRLLSGWTEAMWRQCISAAAPFSKPVAGMIQRSEQGLAFVEKTPAGTYIVANPSPTAATVTVTLPALMGLKAFNLDEQNKRTSPVEVSAGQTGGSIRLQLKPASKIEFASS